MRGASFKMAAKVASAVLVMWSTIPAITASADPSPPYVAPDAPWLSVVNYYRQMAGLPSVVEDPGMSSGSYLHSCYMLLNGIAHDEIPGKPGYTVEGDTAGNNGNVAVSSAFNATARSHIELWMTGPFHAIGVLRPNLQSVGFGKCDNESTTPWRSGATLDVLRGLVSAPAPTQPILFPGNGMTTNLDRFVVESPSPLPYCGFSGQAGLPVIALMPEPVAGAVSASIVGPAGPLETCALSQNNTDGIARSILQGNNAVVALTRNKLEPGTYTVTVNTPTRSVSWSFTVDPAAATGVMPAPTPPPPAPTASPSAPASGLQPITPVRLVDTREAFGADTLAGQASSRIQLGGRGGVPYNATAVSANFTVTNTSWAGYLTVWNCSAERPVVATLNFGPYETVANGASVPLDGSGGLCVFSPVGTDLVIDINGYYGSSAPDRFTPVTPTRLMDTRVGHGPSWRLGGGQTVALKVTETAGVPANVGAVTLNVASVDPSVDGFVTVWPCDAPQPLAASLNPVVGRVKPNLVVAPVAGDGTVCFYSSSDVDLVVDVMGYLSSKSSAKFTPTRPFRFTDTRDAARLEVNAGTAGNSLAVGQTLTVQVAGQRGVPSNAKAVSVNIAVTGAQNPGFITAWPCGDRPTTANVNYEAVNAISNGAHVPLSSSGKLCIYTMSNAHLIIDVNGWWS